MQDTAAQPRDVGHHIREWRQRRRMTQLGLALDAEISARHLSFLETGKAQPSREMVLHLCERLDVPLRGLDSLCARPRRTSTVGAEESLRRGRTKEKAPQKENAYVLRSTFMASEKRCHAESS
jgi:transcriptional regulator with XRE-family HTH domain